MTFQFPKGLSFCLNRAFREGGRRFLKIAHPINMYDINSMLNCLVSASLVSIEDVIKSTSPVEPLVIKVYDS